METLRILKTASSADEQAEAHYRHRVYANYEECVEALSSTTDSIDNTAKEVSTYLRRIKYSLKMYLEMYSVFLEHMDSQTDQQTPSNRLGEMQRVTGLFMDELELLFRKQIWTEMLELYCDDGILDPDECLRLLRELRNRKAKMAHALKRIEAVVSKVQDRTEELCGDAAEFLGCSKVKDKEGCEDFGMRLDRIREGIKNITFHWKRKEDEEDDFRMEG